jgi:hypothetical protein
MAGKKRPTPQPRLTPPRVPGTARLEAIYNELMQRPNVVGCYVGRKRTRGRETKAISIVCVVNQKIKKKDLDPGMELLPAEIEWPASRDKRLTVATDVQLIGGPFQPAAAASVTGPGDDIRRPMSGGASPERATVGLAMQHPLFGHVVTTAGHLFLNGPGNITWESDNRPRVMLANSLDGGTSFRGIGLKAVVSSLADYALVMPENQAPAANRFRDLHPIGGPYLPSADDIGSPLLVLSRAGIRKTRFVGVAASLPAGVAGVMRRLIVTTFNTEAGDSGSCLVDMQSRLWGLLVGSGEINGRAHSVFISSVVPLSMEQATYL